MECLRTPLLHGFCGCTWQQGQVDKHQKTHLNWNISFEDTFFGIESSLKSVFTWWVDYVRMLKLCSMLPQISTRWCSDFFFYNVLPTLTIPDGPFQCLGERFYEIVFEQTSSMAYFRNHKLYARISGVSKLFFWITCCDKGPHFLDWQVNPGS